MNYITMKNYIENKCTSPQSNPKSKTSLTSFHLTLKKTFKKNQPYKHQIDSLNNELNKLKINYDILLINTQPHNSLLQHSQKDYNDDNNYNEGKLIIKEQTPKTLISFENEKHYTKLYSTLYSFSPLLLKRKRITSACVHLWS